MNTNPQRRTLLGLAATAWLPLTARAAEFPERPVRFIVPFATGGGDAMCRVIAPGMSQALGQNVFVENRPGASGMIGMAEAARAAPDGYTIVFGSIGPMVIGPHFLKPSYDTQKDFEPIGMLGEAEGVIVVRADFPARTLAQFVDVLKKDPNKYAIFGTSSHGGPNHLAGLMFAKAAGLSMQHVPYKGDGPGIVDLLGGSLPLMFSTMGSVYQHIQSGKLRAIATFGARRSAALPDVPTVTESGYPMLYSAWFGLYGPANVPKDRVARLSGALNDALRNPAIKAGLDQMGLTFGPGTPDELRERTRTEFARWGAVIRENNIKVE
jgi:tripartite-type tricarboxylate transporter receptor subunit TctC